MTLLTDEARAWGERIVSKMDIANMPEKYRQKAEMDLQLFKAALVADDLLDALKEVFAAVFGTSLGDEPDVYADYDRLSSLCALARAALAKAEGRE